MQLTMDCCGEKYSNQFDLKLAQAELAGYRKGEIKKNSRPLLEALIGIKPVGASVLDIGGGIGALDFELFKVGISNTIHVELSEPFSTVFRQEAERRSLQDKVQCYQGDFLQLRDKIENVDLVCLDKVICCYQHYESLIALSASKSQKWYAYVIPRDVWWVKFAESLKTFFQRFMSNPFLTYVHPVAAIEQLVIASGFRKISEHRGMIWQTTVYERV
jgi:magnesium-protoporphyrin O-methyltransferase